jgi:ADP-dependent NAD(P)H-hydrate dehydratase / NAD(P)H-hydrate epimerase
MKIASVKEMQNMDKKAIEQYGIRDNLLMENAGVAAYLTIAKNFTIENNDFLIFSGVGNNGGDGLVLARKLFSNGAKVSIFILSDPAKYKNAARDNWNIVQKLNIPIIIKPKIEEIESTIKPEQIIVDAIFGTGLTRDIEGYYFQIIQLINKKNNQVISLDIPSGIDGDTGIVKGIAIKANYTVTFGLPKIGNILYPGYEYTGKLYVSHISFPPELYNQDDLKIQVNTPLKIPARPIEGHKGTFGNALIIAGARNYYGAPYFSSFSFLKSGGGYSRLAAPSSIIPYISTRAHEVVFLPQEETSRGSLSQNNFNKLLEWSNKVDIVIIGPGISLDDDAQELARKLIMHIDKPILVDGDGLTALSQNISILENRKNATILTPHIGEMSRLLQKTVNEIKENPINLLQKFAKHFNVTVTLKGAHTIIGLPDGNIFINMTGNCGMASAGSGDVLTGTIAAMFCLGLPVESAARQGVLIHGFAGDLATREKGEDGITARDIMESLPEAMKIVRNKQDSLEKIDFSGLNIIN